MIGEVVRGNSMPDLVSYLFGPGKRNEHVNQHLVGGYADAVFTADDRLWQDEPGACRKVRKEARTLGWQLEFPHSRWQPGIADGYVWHCSLSIKAGEGLLTDEQWTEAAHEVIKALGFDGADGKATCRWIAVRHGLSENGNDHIHLAVNLVREDGTKASTWNDYRKVARVCTGLEDRFGLAHVTGRMTGRSLPEPSRADTELSAKRGDPEPLRIGLERKVRACAAIATSEDHFTRLAHEKGLLVRPHYGPDGSTINGYAFADAAGRHARDPKTGAPAPIWFGGGKLAPDLAVGKLRARWQNDMHSELTAAADALAVAAITAEPGNPGTLSRAARHMARAAQEPCPAAAIIADMADTFLTVTMAGTQGHAVLVRELSALIDTCVTRAVTATAARETRKASVLVHATAETLARQADQQARHALTGGITMPEPAGKDDLVTRLKQLGGYGDHLIYYLTKEPDIENLYGAGFTETTPCDDVLRRALGEERWASYIIDPARIVAAAVIDQAEYNGYGMRPLIADSVGHRDWEEARTGSARSVARVLATLLVPELARHQPGPPTASTRLLGDETRLPPAGTPFDPELRRLLGDDRWRQYAQDRDRRPVVASLITLAADQGRDMDALLTRVVTSRECQDDAGTPARSVAAELHYRLCDALARRDVPPRQDLPPGTADMVARSTATGSPAPKQKTARKGLSRSSPPGRARPAGSSQRDD